MLIFNPVHRSSAKSLLKDKLFDSIRVPCMEEGAKKKIDLEVDHLIAFKSREKEIEWLNERLTNEIEIVRKTISSKLNK